VDLEIAGEDAAEGGQN